MMTQTHLLAAAALLARPSQPLRNTALAVGALLPDAAIFALFAWSKLAAIPERTVWDEIYFSDTFQAWSAAGNSVPLWLLVLLAGVVFLRIPALFRIGIALFFASLAALLHIALDFPLHHDDAHRHLWPLSDWRFRSSVSYWDPAHHGRTFMWFEAALGILLSVILWRRFRTWWVRTLLAMAVVAYVAVPAYFVWSLGSGGAT